MNLSERLDRFGARTRPHYGMLVLWTLLLCAAAQTGYFLSHWPAGGPSGPRIGPATIFSWLPDALLLSRWTALACGFAFVAGAALWAAGRLAPWSCWAATLSFTAVVALYAENATQLTHVAHLTNLVLFVYAGWWQAYRKEIRAARSAGRFWGTALYPRWAYALGVLCVGLFYGYSGLTKWYTSGAGWANGVSMQLWARLWGDPGTVWTRLVLSDRRTATALQWAALLGETSGLVAIVSTRLRPWVGLALIGFHVGQIAVFGWGFHANMLILALAFLPFYDWVPRLVRWRERAAAAVATTAPVRAEASAQGSGRLR